MAQSKFFKNSAYGMVGSLGSALLGFFSGVVVARVLGVEGAGTVAFTVWLAATIASFGDFGLPSAITRFLPELLVRGEQREALGLSSFLFLRMLTLTASILVAFVALVLFADMAGLSEFRISATLRSNWVGIASLVAAQLLCNYAVGYLKGFQYFKMYALLNIVSACAQFFIILVGCMTFGTSGALFGYFVGNIIMAFVLRSPMGPHGSISKELRRRVWHYSIKIWAANIVSCFTWSRMELLFLERAWGNTDVGLFNASLIVASLATQGPMLITSGFLPYFAERYGIGDIEGLHRAFGSTTRVLAFLILPASLGTAAIAPKLLPLLFGQDFVRAVPSAMIVTSVAGLCAIASTSALLLNTMERNSVILLQGLVGAALSIAAGLIVIPAFGVNGAAVSRAVVQLIMVASGYWYVVRRVNCTVPFREVGRILIAGLFCALIALLIVEAAPGLWPLPVAVLGGAVVYFFTLRLLGGLPKEDIAVLERWMLAWPPWTHQSAQKFIWLIR